MSSVSVSESASESCCFPSTCACDTWLTAFCDYETVTLSYCDVQTEFNFARSDDIPIVSVNPDAGVLPADRIFRLSMTENTVSVGIGATITDQDGTEWVVYKVEALRSFCVKKLWVRSVAVCYQLLDTIDLFEQDCECEDCGTNVKYKRVARVKGRIFAEAASRRTQNESSDLVYQYTGNMIKWPLSTKPSAVHRLKTKEGVFRIIRVQDRGPFVPFVTGLEKDSADCSV
jgi:hypothetical protein